MSGAEWIEVVWLTEDDEGGVGVWRDPDNARRQIAQDRAAELPGVYEWVNDPDRTHELLLHDDEPTGLTLRMMLVADAAPGADPVTAEQQQDGAVGRVEAFLAAWNGYDDPDGYVVCPDYHVVRILKDAGEWQYLALPDLRAVLAERTALAAPAAELTAGQDMCTCNEPRKVCELRTELDRVHAQLNAALAERPEES